MKQKNSMITNEQQRFSLRKLSVGLASVLLGTSLYVINSPTQTVKADTIANEPQEVQTTKNSDSAETKEPTSEVAVKNVNDTVANQPAVTNTDKSNAPLTTTKANETVDTSVPHSTDNVNSTSDTNNVANTANDEHKTNVTNDEHKTDSTDITNDSQSSATDTHKTDQVPSDTNTESKDPTDEIKPSNSDTTKPDTVTDKPKTKISTKKTYENTDFTFDFDETTGALVITPKNGSVTVAGPQTLFGFNNLVGDDATEKVTSVTINGKIKISGSASYLFGYKCTNITEIKGLNNLDTSQVTDMSNMFKSTHKLVSLDLSSLDTSNVKNMSEMFRECYVTNLDLSNFNTSKVTNMLGMFNGCHASSINLSSFDTSNVTDMSDMFSYCTVKALDLSTFDVRKVKNFSGFMFFMLYLRSFTAPKTTTDSAENMRYMFCNSWMDNIDTKWLKTDHVMNMSHMFDAMFYLKSLDVSHFNTSNVIDMSNMFSNDSTLTDLDISSFDTSNVINMSEMFKGLNKIKNLDVSHFNTSKVQHFDGMFSGNDHLTNLDLHNFDTSNATSKANMLSGLRNIRYIILGDKTNLRDAGLNEAGYWLNVGTGTNTNPQADKNWSSAELMANYNPETDADTYIRGYRFKFHYIDLDNNNAEIPLVQPAYINVLLTKYSDEIYLNDSTYLIETQEMRDNKDKLKAAHYVVKDDPFKYTTPGDERIFTVEPSDVNITFKHELTSTPESVKHNLTIHYVDQDNKQLQEDTVVAKSFNRVKTHDLVTNKDTFTDWTASKDQEIPLAVIKGYVTDKAKVNTNDVTADKDQEITQVYQKVGNYVPIDKHGEIIKGLNKIPYENDPTDPTKVKSTVPTIDGYTAVDKEKVPSDPTKDMQAMYLENNKTIIQFIDQDNDSKPIDVDAINSTTEIGKEIVKPSSADTIVKQLQDKGYELVTDPFAGQVTATDGTQILQYVFKHKLDTNQADTITKQQTIHFVDSNGQKVADDKVQNATFTRTGTKDLVTGKITWNDWSAEQTLAEVKVPVVKGYIAETTIIPSTKIDATKNIESTVKYQEVGNYVPVDKYGNKIIGLNPIPYENDPNDPTKIVVNAPAIEGHTVGNKNITVTDPTKDTNVEYLINNQTVIGFIDKDNNNQAIPDVDNITSSTEIGKTIEKPANIDEIIKNLADKGYELVTDPFKDPVTATDGKQVINYVFKHKTDTQQKETVTRKQTIHFVDSNGKPLADDKVTEVKFTRTGIKDIITGKITWSEWSKDQTIPEAKNPVIKGYVTDKAATPSQVITAEKDVETTVTYHKLGNYVPVDANGKTITGTKPIPYENDADDPTRIKADQVLPDINGYTKPKLPIVKDLTKDTKVVYQLIPTNNGGSTSPTNNGNNNPNENKPDVVPDKPDNPEVKPLPKPHKKPTKPIKKPKHKSENKTNTTSTATVANVSAHSKYPAATINSPEVVKKVVKTLPQTGSDTNSKDSLILLALGLALFELGSFIDPNKRKHE